MHFLAILLEHLASHVKAVSVDGGSEFAADFEQSYKLQAESDQVPVLSRQLRHWEQT